MAAATPRPTRRSPQHDSRRGTLTKDRADPAGRRHLRRGQRRDRHDRVLEQRRCHGEAEPGGRPLLGHDGAAQGSRHARRLLRPRRGSQRRRRPRPGPEGRPAGGRAGRQRRSDQRPGRMRASALASFQDAASSFGFKECGQAASAPPGTSTAPTTSAAPTAPTTPTTTTPAAPVTPAPSAGAPRRRQAAAPRAAPAAAPRAAARAAAPRAAAAAAAASARARTPS